MNIDLHRHAGGSITPETVWEIIQSDKKMGNLAESLDDLYRMMTFKDDEKRNFHHFLKKFNVQNHIMWNEAAIDLTMKQIIGDMRKEELEYCELRFSIDKYLSYIPWDEHEACLFVLQRIDYWAKEFKVKVGPVLSIKYEASYVTQKRLSKLVNHWRIAEQLVGLDLVGNEAMANRKRLRDIYRYWRACGKGLLAHAGESQGVENVRMAIQDLKVNRIAHGIRIVDDPELMALAKDNGIAFDVAITSNAMTGVVKGGIGHHPIRKMYEEGLIITIGTDDPVTFCTSLPQEYDLATMHIGRSHHPSTVKHKLMKASVEHALVPLSQT